MKSENNGPDNLFVESVTLNGKVLEGGKVEYAALMEGGDLTFVMRATSEMRL